MGFPDDECLQKLCLHSIVQDFDRFCRNFSSPTGIIPTRYYQFIQQHYTHNLLQMLLELDLLKNEHLMFIINEHVKELNLYHFADYCDLDVVKEHLLVVGHTLTKLSMFGEATFSILQPILGNLCSIEVLVLEYTACGDASLQIIAKNCPLIKTLNVYACLEVTDDGMKIICSHEYNKLAIENLDVDRTSVTDVGICYVLENMPSLKIIMYANLPQAICTAVNKKVQGDDELVINKVYNLESIVITRPRFTLNPCSLLCPFITELNIKNIDMKEQIQTCTAFKRLEHLTMKCSARVEDICVNGLLVACGSNIKFLCLHNFSISAEALALNCPKLVDLILDNPTFQTILFRDVANLKFSNLRAFHLNGISFEFMNPVKSTSFIINSSPKLDILSIKDSKMTPYIEKVLLNCKTKFRNINFISTQVEPEFLQDILQQQISLEKLSIQNCGFSGVGITGYDKIIQIDEMVVVGI